MPEPTDTDLVELRIQQHGETFIQVPRTEYEDAKAEGALEYLLTTAAARLPLTTEVQDPAGASTQLGGAVEHEAIHGYFELSYANYEVLPRSLLQSMPDEWQTRFVRMLEEFRAAFQHVQGPDLYKVEAATEHTVSEMSPDELKRAGITEDWYGGEEPPEDLTDEALHEWQHEHEQTSPDYYDADGNELDPHRRFLLPAHDPIPHYNRGRTHIEPRLEIGHE